MRDIKFRAYIGGKMVRVLAFYPRILTGEYHVMLGINAEAMVDEVFQFTGLQDKNGVEIFEGDIVVGDIDDGDKPFVVEMVWMEVDAFEVMGWNIWGFMDATKADGRRTQSYYEVIGNIHENGELLEE